MKQGLSPDDAARTAVRHFLPYYGRRDMSFMEKPCYVYVLINPDSKQAFYIGISVNPWWRFYAHCKDPCSAAYPALKLMFDGRDLFQRDEVLKIYRVCRTRQEALDLEYRLVTSTPGLLNRPYKRGKAYS
jgi:predicted GIY-YIG superfamily endonuclease